VQEVQAQMIAKSALYLLAVNADETDPHRYLRHWTCNSKKNKRTIYGKAYDTNKVSEMEDLFKNKELLHLLPPTRTVRPSTCTGFNMDDPLSLRQGQGDIDIHGDIVFLDPKFIGLIMAALVLVDLKTKEYKKDEMVKYTYYVYDLQDNPHYAEEANDQSKLEHALETLGRAGKLEGRALQLLFRRTSITKLEIKGYIYRYTIEMLLKSDHFF
jgi:hypothetical protein